MQLDKCCVKRYETDNLINIKLNILGREEIARLNEYGKKVQYEDHLDIHDCHDWN